MTRFQPPPDVPGPYSEGAFGPEAPPEFSGPPPMSAAALTGFICSLIFCLPVLGPLLGLIFGIVGIGTTAGGRRRGRGLAIAAILISLLVGAGQGAGGYVGGTFVVRLVRFPSRVETVFRASATLVPEASAEVYKNRSSQVFRDKVTQEQFQAWVSGVITRHGQLQSAEGSQQPVESTTDGRMVARRTGQFVNGSASIEIFVSLNTQTWRWEFDDIRIDGQSPVPEK